MLKKSNAGQKEPAEGLKEPNTALFVSLVITLYSPDTFTVSILIVDVPFLEKIDILFIIYKLT
jgi:hypothetical protein